MQSKVLIGLIYSVQFADMIILIFAMQKHSVLMKVMILIMEELYCILGAKIVMLLNMN